VDEFTKSFITFGAINRSGNNVVFYHYISMFFIQMIYYIDGYKLPYYNSRKVRVNLKKTYFLNDQNTVTIAADVLKLFIL